MSEEELAVQYMPLCRSLSHRYHRTHFGTDADHLYSEALLAMVLAIRSHDPSKSQIQTHIEYRVKRSLIDYDRDYSRCRQSIPVAANTQQMSRHFDMGGPDARLDATRLSLRLLLDAVESRSPQGAKRVAVFEFVHQGFAGDEIATQFGFGSSRVSQLLGELADEIRWMVKRKR